MKIFYTLIILFLVSFKSWAQCPQVEITSTLNVSLTNSNGETTTPDIIVYAGIACGGTNPVFSSCTTPPSYNTSASSTNATTISNILISQNTHSLSDPLDNSYTVNLTGWEEDQGATNSYDCTGQKDDDYFDISRVIALPARDASGCFASTTKTDVFSFASGAAATDPSGLNCGTTGGTWTLTVTTTIRYVAPAPTGNSVSIFQCGAMPTLSVNTCTDASYQWQGGAGSGTVSGSQNQFYTPSASEVNVAVPGTYPITVKMVHPCDASLSSATTLNVVVIKECPEIETVTVNPLPKACKDDNVNLSLTLKAPSCSVGSYTEGTDYLVQWYMDGTKIYDGMGPDGKVGTADDITNLTNTTYTIPYTGAACSTQDHIFEAQIICKQPEAPAISQGTLDAYCASSFKQQYDGAGSSILNGYPTAASGCQGVSGSQGPSAGTVPMSNYFNACTGQFNNTAFGGSPAQFQLNLTTLPACAEVISVEYQIQGTTSNTCNAAYTNSWASETNFVFYTPSASPTTSNAAGTFSWSNAGFTQCGTPDCNQTGGNYNFVNTITFPSGTSAQGLWQVIIFDDYNDGGASPDGEVNYVYMKVNYYIPPGCTPNTIQAANAVTTFDIPVITVTPAIDCGVAPTISGCNLTYDADGTGGYLLTSNPNTTPGSTIYVQSMVTDAPAGCLTQTTATITTCAPLPVKLISFTGNEMGDKNLLKWSTASEINANRFEIETSINNNSGFKSIGYKTATGSQAIGADYDFVDENPTNTAYYRLKIIDNDGSFEYSNIVKIQRKVKGISIVQLLPNPTQNNATLDFNVEYDGDYSIDIMTISGKVIYSLSKNCSKNTINSTILNLNDYASGVYFIRIKGSDSVVNQKLIKR